MPQFFPIRISSILRSMIDNFKANRTISFTQEIDIHTHNSISFLIHHQIFIKFKIPGL
ncbi:hypothetical protein FPZ42_12150 [Mucilaginibacter achroorhodeus]|uniref:Uncharacterized protein n=1 Tax=Mucilaginibacter achroorhodeus TaxID=2599294 RepID=A0A563U2A3_9SPHI|nr:hypothetical protein FPZ42_12150 [Mucilaginibacter achroorhodeus]